MAGTRILIRQADLSQGLLETAEMLRLGPMGRDVASSRESHDDKVGLVELKTPLVVFFSNSPAYERGAGNTNPSRDVSTLGSM